jgi:hypothetical protein
MLGPFSSHLRAARASRLVLAFAFGAFATGCGDVTENSPPIIDTVEAPLVVSEHDGAYAIPVTVLFHDNDGEAVTHLRYRLPPNIDGMIDVPAPNPTRESAAVTIIVRADDLDGEVPTTRSQSTSDDDGRTGNDARSEGETKRGRDRSRSRPRVLQLSIIDYRGAESLPQSSSVTLD